MTAQKLYLGERGALSGGRDHLRLRALDGPREELEELGARLSEDPSNALMERWQASERVRRDGGYEYRARAASTISSLGFAPEDRKRPVGSFSGGEQSRSPGRLLMEGAGSSSSTNRPTTSTCAP